MLTVASNGDLDTIRDRLLSKESLLFEVGKACFFTLCTPRTAPSIHDRSQTIVRRESCNIAVTHLACFRAKLDTCFSLLSAAFAYGICMTNEGIIFHEGGLEPKDKCIILSFFCSALFCEDERQKMKPS